jgi:ribosomal protein L32
MGLLWLLILIGLGALAYFAMKGRIIRLREEFEQAMRKATQGRRSSLPSEDMVKCPTCGTYSAPGQTKNCGKAACPYK